MSYRKIISKGDLVLTYKPWYSLGKYVPFRNLSEEVRLLKEHQEKAGSKYRDLSRLYAVASANIADELETLQLFLLDNSDVDFESSMDTSILEEREGIRYNFNRGGNNKKGSSSNKENQQKQKQNQQGGGKPRGISMADLFLKGRITLQ